MPGRLVCKWPATAVSYLVVSPRRLEIVSPSLCSSAWGRGRSLRGPNLVSKAGGEPRGCCAWPRIPWHSGSRGEQILPTRVSFQDPVSVSLGKRHMTSWVHQQSVWSSNVGSHGFTALTRSTVSLVRAVDGWPVCGSSSMDVRPFLNWEYHSNVLDRLNAVSVNACCSISYVSLAVLPSFWQNLMQTRCSFNTSIHNTTEAQTRLDCRSTHSRLTSESSCHPLLWYVASGDVAKYPTWLSLRYC
jgi:hypothetical protein